MSETNSSASTASAQMYKPILPMLRLGMLAPPIADQLAAQGLALNPEVVEAHQLDDRAVSRLLSVGILTATEARMARERLVQRISRDLAEKAGAHDDP